MTCSCQDFQAFSRVLKAIECSDHLSLQVYAIGNPFGLDHTLTQVCAPILPKCISSLARMMPLYSESCYSVAGRCTLRLSVETVHPYTAGHCVWAWP